MKCSNCGKNEVSFTYTSNINGKVTRHQLCSECAQKLGYADSMGSMFARTERMMNRMMGSFFGNSLLPFSAFELPAAETFFLPEAGTGMPVSDGEASHEHTAVEQESARGPYLSLDDFKTRTRVSKTLTDAMVRMGILSSLPETNQLSLFDLVQ